MVSADVLVTGGSSLAIAAAAFAPLGQVHLFFPPKEVPQNLGLVSLRGHPAFQTYFMRRNTVPLDFQGRPFPEYQAKLRAMLAAVDSGRQLAKDAAWMVAAAETWVLTTVPGSQA